MSDENKHGLGRFVIRFRLPIGLILLIATGVMAFYATRVKISTSFVGLFPKDHPYVQLYEHYLRYGSAEKVIFVIHPKHGDIFNYDTLKKLQDVQLATQKLPRINHDMVFSLASYLTSYTYAIPGGVAWRTYMFPKVPETKAGLEHLRRLVQAHQQELRTLVSPDFKNVAVEGTFYQGGSQNYTKLFDDIQGIVHKYQDANNVIYVAGEPVVRGYGYYYFPEIFAIFIISISIMLIALFMALGRFSSWWVPAITGSFSALWGLGFVGFMHYDFDPLMLVVPLLLTARDMSHGVQWQRRFYYLLRQGYDQTDNCILTTNYMFPAGVLAIAADLAGIVFISFSGIPVLDHIARAGTVWLAASLSMVFIFQPILMSYLPKPRQRARWLFNSSDSNAGYKKFGEWLARFGAEPGIARGAMILCAVAFLVWGIASGLRAKIGYFEKGTPLYKPTAKVNRDLAAIEKNFPTDEGWIIVKSPPHSVAFGSVGVPKNSIFALKILRMEHDLRSYLMQLHAVRDVRDLADDVVEPANRLLYDAHPKFVGLPANSKIAYYTLLLFMQNRAQGTMNQYMLKNTSCVRVMLTDHTSPTLKKLLAQVNEFNKTYVATHPELKGFSLQYLAGIAGLYAAANQVLFQLDLRNIVFVLTCVFLFCLIAFRSFMAGLMFVFACVLANFGAFIYLRLRDIGLTIDTVPVISLGIGLGVDYGIYTVSRIQDEVMGGMSVLDAAILAKRDTGGTVLIVFAIIFLSLIPWMFSPALFHSNMSMLLALLMFLNLLAGVVVLPAFVTWSNVGFISRFENPQPTKEQHPAAVGHGS